MSDLKKTILMNLSVLLIFIGIGSIAFYTEPEYMCVGNKRYEVTSNMLIATGKECLPIDKE